MSFFWCFFFFGVYRKCHEFSLEGHSYHVLFVVFFKYNYFLSDLLVQVHSNLQQVYWPDYVCHCSISTGDRSAVFDNCKNKRKHLLKFIGFLNENRDCSFQLKFKVFNV